ncbi:MAG: conserved hypothetical protein, membrane [Candidatus Syntrophoarchaeum caldarius]|uniref:Uncharacterized protein n=1 Tax=Candidatus Syntropharchaeum caldarium TaxID=1838285 RepID=A0A1F2PBL9_9EURY|nr:MAG: conserved hypothetical protein, membrane [Candidatus Syntrophoarchaeum caldarius]
MKMKDLAVTGLVLIMLIGAFAPVVSADEQSTTPLPPNKFWGTVNLNGEPLAAGYMVKAYIDGELRGSVIVTTPGKYGEPPSLYLVVDGSASDEGKTITFTLAGVPAEETATWKAMNPPQVLNLTASGEPKETPVPTPTPRPTVTATPAATATQTPAPQDHAQGESSTDSFNQSDGAISSVIDSIFGGNEASDEEIPGESGNLRTIYAILIIEAILIAIGITGILFYFRKKRRGGI